MVGPRDEHRMKNDSTHRSMARSYHSEQKVFANPPPKDRNRFDQFVNKMLSDWDGLETNIVSVVHVKRFKSQEVHVNTAEDNCVPVCWRSWRITEIRGTRQTWTFGHRQLQRDADESGGDSVAQNQTLPPSIAGGDSNAVNTLPKKPQSVDSEAMENLPELLQVICITVITLHLAVSCTFHRSHLSHSIWKRGLERAKGTLSRHAAMIASLPVECSEMSVASWSEESVAELAGCSAKVRLAYRQQRHWRCRKEQPSHRSAEPAGAGLED